MAMRITHDDLTVACLSFLAMGETAADPAAIIERAKIVRDMVGETDIAPGDVVHTWTVDGRTWERLRDGTEREVQP